MNSANINNSGTKSKQKKLTVKDYIIIYFKSKLQHVKSYVVRNSHLQLIIPQFIKENFPENYRGLSPETVARTWREMRERRIELDRENIVVEKLATESKEDIYKVYYKEPEEPNKQLKLF